MSERDVLYRVWRLDSQKEEDGRVVLGRTIEHAAKLWARQETWSAAEDEAVVRVRIREVVAGTLHLVSVMARLHWTFDVEEERG